MRSFQPGKRRSQGFGLNSFTDDELYDIHLATLEVLEKTGLFIDTDEALDLFDGYGAQVGQFAIVGFTAGFATGYDAVVFKAKGLNNDLIRVKFLDAGDYIDVNLATSAYSSDLGNGWYQVSIPIADFTGVDTATGLLFETDNTAAAAFQFLLTDFGFATAP